MLSHSLIQQNGSWSVSSVELLKHKKPRTHYCKMLERKALSGRFNMGRPRLYISTCVRTQPSPAQSETTWLTDSVGLLVFRYCQSINKRVCYFKIHIFKSHCIQYIMMSKSLQIRG